MSELRSVPARVWLGASVFVAIVIYVGGYFVLGDHTSSPGHIYRAFQSSAPAYVYVPLGWLESKIRQRTVSLTIPGRQEFEEHMIYFEP